MFLAERGWFTVGVDNSSSALDRAEAAARECGVPVTRSAVSRIPATFHHLHLIQADLETFELPAARFDVILNFRYLQRSLFPQIERALKPGGVLVFETFTLDQLAFEHGPRNPGHLLRPGELREAFPGLAHIFYREWKSLDAGASLLARKSSPSKRWKSEI